jgi:hypothetical protein
LSQDQWQLEKEPKISSETALTVSDAESEMEAFALPELSLEVEFHSFLP